MNSSHLRHLAACFALGAAPILNGGAIGRAQTSASGSASAPTSAPSQEQLLQPGKAAFDRGAPAELEVKKARTGRLLVRPVENGRAAGWFIFDTGAGVDCVTLTSVAELGLRQTGSVEAAGGGGTANALVCRARELTLGSLRRSPADGG